MTFTCNVGERSPPRCPPGAPRRMRGEAGLVAFQAEDFAAAGVHVRLVLLAIEDKVYLVDEEAVFLFEIGVLNGRAREHGEGGLGGLVGRDPGEFRLVRRVVGDLDRALEAVAVVLDANLGDGARRAEREEDR